MEYSNNNNGDQEFSSKIVQIRRVTKVVKGGKKMSFRAVVIVGNKKGSVGLGIGKANEVPSAIRKATEDGKKNLVLIPFVGTTIPHDTIGKFGATKTIIKPARAGRGVIAGGSVRTILELGGVKDVVAKSIGSSNSINVARATLDGLASLKKLDEEIALRGKDIKIKFLGNE